MGRSAYKGVSDGQWAVFAQKVVEERDEARAEVERLRAAITRFVDQYPWQQGPEIQELKALKEGEGHERAVHRRLCGRRAAAQHD